MKKVHSICIDSIGLCYDYIGLQDEMPRVEGGQITVKYDAIPKEFTSVEGTEFNHPNGETLYTEFEGSVSKFLVHLEVIIQMMTKQ